LRLKYALKKISQFVPCQGLTLFWGKSDQKTQKIQTGIRGATPIVSAPRDKETQGV
jgi:hypothetical protein